MLRPPHALILSRVPEVPRERGSRVKTAAHATRDTRITNLNRCARPLALYRQSTPLGRPLTKSYLTKTDKRKNCTESATGTVAKFEQVAKSDNQPLPTFGSETDLYYSKGQTPKLTAFTNKTVSADALKVSGSPGQLSIEDAKAIVAKELKVNPQLLNYGREGIYLVGDNPKNARVAVLIPVQVDPQHEDIKVFVDGQTRQILDIK